MAIANIPAFEQAILRDIDTALLASIREKRELTPELDLQLKTFFEKVTPKFLTA